jgi:hypothetical protein
VIAVVIRIEFDSRKDMQWIHALALAVEFGADLQTVTVNIKRNAASWCISGAIQKLVTMTRTSRFSATGFLMENPPQNHSYYVILSRDLKLLSDSYGVSD